MKAARKYTILFSALVTALCIVYLCGPIIGGLLVYSPCLFNPTPIKKEDVSKLASVRLGMTEQEFRSMFGEPLFVKESPLGRALPAGKSAPGPRVEKCLVYSTAVFPCVVAKQGFYACFYDGSLKGAVLNYDDSIVWMCNQAHCPFVMEEAILKKLSAADL